MKTVYRVIDRKSGEIRFESYRLDDCHKYVSDNSCTFSTVIRKATIHK